MSNKKITAGALIQALISSEVVEFIDKNHKQQLLPVGKMSVIEEKFNSYIFDNDRFPIHLQLIIDKASNQSVMIAVLLATKNPEAITCIDTLDLTKGNPTLNQVLTKVALKLKKLFSYEDCGYPVLKYEEYLMSFEDFKNKGCVKITTKCKTCRKVHTVTLTESEFNTFLVLIKNPSKSDNVYSCFPNLTHEQVNILGMRGFDSEKCLEQAQEKLIKKTDKLINKIKAKINQIGLL